MREEERWHVDRVLLSTSNLTPWRFIREAFPYHPSTLAFPFISSSIYCTMGVLLEEPSVPR